MNEALAGLFFSEDMKKKYQELKPFEGCDKCKYGLQFNTHEICDCSIKTVLNLILSIPKRYDVEIKLSKSLTKQLANFKNFILITGEEKYTKLLAFHLAKEFIAQNKVVKYVRSKGLSVADKARVVDDIVSFNKAEVVIFEDVFKDYGNIEYKSELTKRIDEELPTIFIGKTKLIKTEDDDDFLEVEVDSNDIEVIK